MRFCFDVTNVYPVGEGAARAQQAADITLAVIDDVAKYKGGRGNPGPSRG